MADSTVKFGNILPWEDVVVCTEAPEDVTDQGVYMAPSGDEKKKPEKGIIVAIGASSEEGKKLPINLVPGDLIFYERYTANIISDGGKDYNFVRFKYIMGAKKKA